MIPVDGTVMREIAPRFSGKMAERQAEIIKEAGQVLQATLDAYEINTRLRIAHFLGQTCHEFSRLSHHGGICQRCCL